MTDSAVIGVQKEGLFGRDLAQWGDGDAVGELKDLPMSNSGNWDQFEANKILFNIESTYDENLYTTKLDYEKADAALAARAEKMALEIAKEPSTNPHIREERGQELDNNASEEDRFSGVIDASRTYQNAAPAAKPVQKGGTPSNIWARAPKSVKAAGDGEILEDGKILEKTDEDPKEKELKSKDAPAPESSKESNKKKHKEGGKAKENGGDAGKKSKPAEDSSGAGVAKSPGSATDGAPNAALQQPQQQKPEKNKKVHILDACPSVLLLSLPSTRHCHQTTTTTTTPPPPPPPCHRHHHTTPIAIATMPPLPPNHHHHCPHHHHHHTATTLPSFLPSFLPSAILPSFLPFLPSFLSTAASSIASCLCFLSSLPSLQFCLFISLLSTPFFQNAAPATKPAQRGTRAPKSVKMENDGESLKDVGATPADGADKDLKDKELRSKNTPAPEGSKKSNKEKHKDDRKASEQGGDTGKQTRPAEDPSVAGVAKTPGGVIDGAPNAALQQPQQQKPKKKTKRKKRQQRQQQQQQRYQHQQQVPLHSFLSSFLPSFFWVIV
jgi:hypothetical protein